MHQLKICILGGTGFVGRSIASQLVDRGHRVIVLARRRERNRDMLVLPTLTVAEGDVHDPAFLDSQFPGMDVVVNLIGILNEKGHRGHGFTHAHVDLADKVLQAMQRAQVPRLLHMSALNADPEGPSHYLRSKGRAEILVQEQGARHDIAVTSFRPSVIFGPLDSFTNRFADLLKQVPFVFPLACPDARFQPVYVEDVADCFVGSIGDHDSYGQGWDLCGPKVYTLFEIVSYLQKLLGTEKRIIRLADWQARLQASVMDWLPGKPFSRDNYRSLQVDSVCPGESNAPYPQERQSMENIVPTYMRKHEGHLDALRRLARR